MKLFYIDQSFFLETNRSAAMLLRFISRLKESDIDVLLISTPNSIKNHYTYQEFILLLQQLDILVIDANQAFHLGQVQGEMSEDKCIINRKTLLPIANSYLEIMVDNDKMITQYYYLDIIKAKKNIHSTQIMSVKDLENFIEKSIANMKNPKKLS